MMDEDSFFRRRRYKNIRRKTYETKAIHEANILREHFNLPLIAEKERECLRCSIVFKSEGHNNRMCYHCSSYTDQTGTVEHGVYL